MIQCVPWSNCAGWAFKSTANVFARTKRGCSCENKSHLVFLLPWLFAFMKASVVHQRCEKPRPRSMAYVSGVGFQPPSTCEEWSWSPALEMAGEDSDSRLFSLVDALDLEKWQVWWDVCYECPRYFPVSWGAQPLFSPLQPRLNDLLTYTFSQKRLRSVLLREELSLKTA